MITTDGMATLSIYSDHLTAAQITDVLGIPPTRTHERGDPTYAARSGRPHLAKHLTYPQAQWHLNSPVAEGFGAFGSLRALLDSVKPQATRIRDLRPSCETIIWWHGSSDSSQGGFAMPANVISDLAAIGCDLYGTTYLAEED
ncbi:hypothetical protein J2Y69_002554 [Microbacterium resistens]|uniref:DUF4279 domain-containing protein n=1 Tax=Microbacterium resistens TaxID=156977 RepID=A0ABU1SEB5_9MICO|nr:DUF4279 domain-containing protein [Microbacterium resistens]MDR6867946.1 hypothetical protein [Microbacterium resistens]